jgi:integral membrane sensor domain MASE1
MITAGLLLAFLMIALSIVLLQRRIGPGHPIWWSCCIVMVAAFALGKWA